MSEERVVQLDRNLTGIEKGTFSFGKTYPLEMCRELLEELKRLRAVKVHGYTISELEILRNG